MKKLWLSLLVAALANCSERQRNAEPESAHSRTVDRVEIIDAIRHLKVIPDKDAFLVFVDALDESHYIQFAMEDGRLVFERPILAESKKGLPVIPARYYVPISDRPKIESPVAENFLSPQEAKRAESYLGRWELPTAHTFIATEEPKGVVVEYFERFHGSVTIPDERFPEFVNGFFHDVYGIDPSHLKLKIKTK